MDEKTKMCLAREPRTGNPKIFLVGYSTSISDIKMRLIWDFPDVCIIHPGKMELLGVLCECSFDLVIIDKSFVLDPETGFFGWRYFFDQARFLDIRPYLLVDGCEEGHSKVGFDYLVKSNNALQIETILGQVEEGRRLEREKTLMMV